MSLSFEGFVAALEEAGKVREKMKKLIGFDPVTSNHYGRLQLYNITVTSRTPDEKILKIRSDYLEWKREVLEFFDKHGCKLGEEEYGNLFSASVMFGTISFLGIPLDIYGGIEPYREKMLAAIKDLT